MTYRIEDYTSQYDLESSKALTCDLEDVEKSKAISSEAD